jgi:hypothetical protein
MTWDESTIKKMKEYKDLLDINSPINELYWHEESYESQALNDASSHLKVAVLLSLNPRKAHTFAHKCCDNL